MIETYCTKCGEGVCEHLTREGLRDIIRDLKEENERWLQRDSDRGVLLARAVELLRGVLDYDSYRAVKKIPAFLKEVTE